MKTDKQKEEEQRQMRIVNRDTWHRVFKVLLAERLNGDVMVLAGRNFAIAEYYYKEGFGPKNAADNFYYFLIGGRI